MLPRPALALLLVWPLIAEKRPLTHNDYDSWRHIQNQALSHDGHYLAYALFPQEGDGELIVRDLATGKQTSQPIGELPPPPKPDFSNPQPEETPPVPPGIAIRFSADSKTLVVSTFARHDDVEKAKRDKRKPEDSPKGDILVMDLSSGAVHRAPGAKAFQLPSKGNGYVAYLQLPEKLPVEENRAKSVEAKAADAKTGGATPKEKKIEIGDLVLRNLRDGTERRFPNVTEYLLSNDAKTLVFATQNLMAQTGGVYAFATEEKAQPTALLAGKGRYEKLAFDHDQTRLALISSRDDDAASEPHFKLYAWDRHASSAVQCVSIESAGFRSGWNVSDKASITFSRDGKRIFFGAAPQVTPEKEEKFVPPDERVSVDLWSWRDDFIQPMQKVRAKVERSRSYRAVYDVGTKQFLQLSDPTMEELLLSEAGNYAIGGDDREYRRMQEFDERYEDAYLVDVSSGARKLVLTKHRGRLSWSPDSKYVIYFNGRDWITVAASGGRIANLTGSSKVSFGREDYDLPSLPNPYGLAGWTKDGQYVLLYDRFDIWRCKPDGSAAVNLTAGAGRKAHVAFRIVRFETDDPDERSIDASRPLLLRAENEDTRESGFYRAAIAPVADPAKLVMEAKNFAVPVKARDADVYATAASTFSEYPDLLITDGTFREFRKVTAANPQMANLLWGTSELIPFKSEDGIPLKAALYKPDNFDAKKKYPLMVYIYERLSQSVFNFVEPRPGHNINVSYYVSNGYLVLEPDIAYKVGYPGQSAMDCVLPAIQEVVDRGFVNEKAIGIQGHSWGGYQIAYMVTRTNRFRAAAAGAPVADMISAYDGVRWGPGIPRQFQYERTQSRIGGSIWDYPLRYIENSPIFGADRVNTPLLMIHNDADDAVPWYQGIEYYLALRRLNKEVYLFTYNGEPHGLRRRADQKDYTVRLQQFFDYFLKGAPEPGWMEHGIPYLDKEGAGVADAASSPQ